MVIVDFNGGPTIDCRIPNSEKTEKQLAETAKTVVHKFVSLQTDACLWSNSKMRSAEGMMLRREGSDAECVIEAADVPATPDPGPGAYLNFLRKKHSNELRLIRSEVIVIQGENWRREDVGLRLPPAPPSTSGVMYQFANWTWRGANGVAMLTCFGPAPSLQAEMPQVEHVAASLKILPVTHP
ncbi:MAG: hypothetical protein ABI411_01940 [Tahibacter sp.]